MELTPLSRVLLWLCGVVLCLWLRQVFLSRYALALSFVLRFGSTFPLLVIRRSKVSFLLFEFLLNIVSIPVCHTKRGDVEELYFLLNVHVQTTSVFEYQMFLRIFDTQLCAQGMEQIRHLMHILIPLLSQCGPLYVLVLIAPHRIVMFLDGVSERIPSGYNREQRGFHLFLFLTVVFPLVLDMGDDFEE